MGNYELPYSSLVWANDDDLAACLLPTDTGKPLTQVALLSLSSGNSTVVLEQAVGSDEGFEIYDVRAHPRSHLGRGGHPRRRLAHIHRAYRWCGSGQSALVEEGDGDWEMPTIAAVETAHSGRCCRKRAVRRNRAVAVQARHHGSERHRDAVDLDRPHGDGSTPPATPWSSRRARTPRPSTTSSCAWMPTRAKRWTPWRCPRP
ncbi:MAG: hypothetical protein ACLSVD_09980 [Eggerthellaceae bacterium]